MKNNKQLITPGCYEARRKRVFGLLSLLFMANLLVITTAQAQGIFTKVTGTPFTPVFSSATAFGDLNGDGAPDLVIFGHTGSTRVGNVFMNDGTGQFTKKTTGATLEGASSSCVALVDIDGDGDLDIFVVGYNNAAQSIVRVYENDGNANFTDVTAPPFDVSFGYYGDIDMADVDNDGDMDVLITGGGSINPFAKLFINDGSGGFTEKTTGASFEGAYYGSTKFFDADGDGDMDVLITGGRSNSGTYDPIAKLYLNDGSGNFTEKTTGVPFEGVSGGATVAVADIDGDGDLDVFIAGQNASGQKTAKLYTNDGSGNFTEVSGTPFASAMYASSVFVDVDGDSDMDLVLVGDQGLFTRSPTATLYTNDGSGNFSKVSGTPFTGVYSGRVSVADIDGDGDMDMLITGRKQNSLQVADLFLNNSVVASAIDITQLDPSSDYCQNAAVTVTYNATGTYNSGNTFTAQLSDANGDFTNATDIGTLTGTTTSGTINALIPGTAVMGSKYRVRIVSSNPAVTGSDNGTDLTINPLPVVGARSTPDPAIICKGDEVTLDYTAGLTMHQVSYTWDNGVISKQPFKPTQTTLYTITAEDQTTGCVNTDTITVTVNPGPHINPSADPGSSICSGDEVKLYGNMLVIPSVSYAWDHGVSNGVGFSPTGTETYTVTATNANNGCTSTDTITVTVNPLPTVTATANPGTDICEGNEVTLNGGGADTYSWDKNVTNGKAFVPIQTETYTVVGTDVNGCENTTDITVNVKDTSIVAVVDTICSGGTYTFGTQTLDKTGTYKEVFVAANGCDSTVNLDLTVNTVDLSITQNGNELKAVGSATSYQWLDCNKGKQPIPGATNQTYTSNDGGDFAVVVTSGGCTDTSVCYHIEGNSGIHNAAFSRQMTLYPNPNNGQMTVNSGDALTNATVRVINVIGQTVMTQEHVSGNSFKVDIHQYAAGIYYVEIRDGAQTARVKFTKK